MSNTITITACDNELILLAYQWGGSFELMRILSGNSNPVNVTINIEAGPYQGTNVINGVNNPLGGTYTVSLPSGQYTLLPMGINWGGPQQFTMNLNGKQYALPYGPQGEGLVWNPGPITFTV